MSETFPLSLGEIETLSNAVLRASGTDTGNARSVARSIMRAEADGIHSHGLFRLPTYAEHVRAGKVDGKATPAVQKVSPAGLKADACTGFAHPAIDAGFAALVPLAKAQGVAALAVTNSYNCGVVGHHVEDLALQGLVALAFVNAPKSMAAHGGKRPFFGTNPIAFATPRQGTSPLVFDMASSQIPRSELQMAAREGRSIPLGWAIDKDGQPTTDAKAAMDGALVPFGNHKGSGIALMADLMAAALTGACFSHEAASFVAKDDGPPRTGQFFIALAPDPFGGPQAAERMEKLFTALLAEPGTHLPGDRRQTHRARHARDGVPVPRALYDTLKKLAAG